MPPAGNLSTRHSGDHQNDADHECDDAQDPQDVDGQQESEYEQDDSENYHGFSVTF